MVDDAEVPLFKFVTGKFPVTPVDNGNPVALVNVTDVGVPKIGVTSVGEIAKTLLPEPVVAITDNAPVPPDVETTPFDVKFESVDIFCDVLTVTVPDVLVKPVENV